MATTAPVSKEKRQSSTLRHDDKSIRNISRTLHVSSSAVAKTIKCYEETGSHEDGHSGRPRVTFAAEDKFIRVTCLRNCSPKNASKSSSKIHISTSTVQRRLCESELHGLIAAKKPLLKDTNKKKRLAWAKKHEQWTLDRWKYVLWSGVQIRDFWFQPLCLCEMRCG